LLRNREGPSKQALTNAPPQNDWRLHYPPDIVVPFAGDADFVERGTTLDQVDQICAAPNAQAALVGLGGVG
jgi:hypothetical protein